MFGCLSHSSSAVSLCSSTVESFAAEQPVALLHKGEQPPNKFVFSSRSTERREEVCLVVEKIGWLASN